MTLGATFKAVHVRHENTPGRMVEATRKTGCPAHACTIGIFCRRPIAH